jgi:CRP-like cAMP-binding protein
MSVESGIDDVTVEQSPQQSLATAAARNLATTTKSRPQMQGITSRWLLRVLPWVQVSGGTYRVNRRLSYAVGRGRVAFVKTGDTVQVAAPTLRELPVLAGYDDSAVLDELATRFEQREIPAGVPITAAGAPVTEIFLIAHGKVNKQGTSKFGEQTVLSVLGDGDHFGDEGLAEDGATWAYGTKSVSACTVLVLRKDNFGMLLDRSESLRAQLDRHRGVKAKPKTKHGEAEIELSSGHTGEVELPGTFVDYELKPREYELSVAQTILRVHTRVADLYNHPMNQTEQQLRLTVEALRERQEHELLNNKEFGLLHNVDYDQRIHTHDGPPTPDDMDELLSRRRNTKAFLAHPRAIAAFGRECNKRGIYPDSVDLAGSTVPAWRGVPVLPCSKIPISAGHTSSIIAMRVGEEDQGVIGLHQTGLPDEYEPGLSVRFMGINEKAIISYLVSAYYSAAVLVPDALGVLEDVEVSRPRDT